MKTFQFTIKVDAENVDWAVEELQSVFMNAPVSADATWRYAKTHLNDLEVIELEDSVWAWAEKLADEQEIQQRSIHDESSMAGADNE